MFCRVRKEEKRIVSELLKKRFSFRAFFCAYIFLTMSALSVRKPRIEDATFCADSSISFRLDDFRIAFVC